MIITEETPHLKMFNETDKGLFPLTSDTIWFSIFVSECIMIFIINAFTIIAFARNHHLRKHTTYLIINLTVVDLLVGTVSEPLEIYYADEEIGSDGFSWRLFCTLTLRTIFPVASQVNLSLISLERLHATLFPFRHCLIGEWIYYKIIIISWLIALLLASAGAVLLLYEPIAIRYVWACYTFVLLVLLTICHVIINAKVKSNPPSQHSGSLVKDRKLTATLFMVTFLSILTIVPWAVHDTIPNDIKDIQMSPAKNYHIGKTVLVLFYANSIVNPLIYAIRMQEFRKAVKELICKMFGESIQVQPVELHAV